MSEAQKKLAAAVAALRAVDADAEARRLLNEVLGRLGSAADLADLVTVALAHSHVALNRRARA